MLTFRFPPTQNGQTTHLQFAHLVDEQILGFEISVKYPSGMAIGEAADELEQEELKEKKKCVLRNPSG